MKISTGHHGIPPKRPKSGILAFSCEDIAATCTYLEELYKLFPFTLPKKWLEKTGKKLLKQQSWFFAGIMILAQDRIR